MDEEPRVSFVRDTGGLYTLGSARVDRRDGLERWVVLDAGDYDMSNGRYDAQGELAVARASRDVAVRLALEKRTRCGGELPGFYRALPGSYASADAASAPERAEKARIEAAAERKSAMGERFGAPTLFLPTRVGSDRVYEYRKDASSVAVLSVSEFHDVVPLASDAGLPLTSAQLARCLYEWHQLLLRCYAVDNFAGVHHGMIDGTKLRTARRDGAAETRGGYIEYRGIAKGAPTTYFDVGDEPERVPLLLDWSLAYGMRDTPTTGFEPTEQGFERTGPPMLQTSRIGRDFYMLGASILAPRSMLADSAGLRGELRAMLADVDALYGSDGTPRTGLSTLLGTEDSSAKWRTMRADAGSSNSDGDFYRDSFLMRVLFANLYGDVYSRDTQLVAVGHRPDAAPWENWTTSRIAGGHYGVPWRGRFVRTHRDAQQKIGLLPKDEKRWLCAMTEYYAPGVGTLLRERYGAIHDMCVAMMQLHVLPSHEQAEVARDLLDLDRFRDMKTRLSPYAPYITKHKPPRDGATLLARYNASLPGCPMTLAAAGSRASLPPPPQQQPTGDHVWNTTATLGGGAFGCALRGTLDGKAIAIKVQALSNDPQRAATERAAIDNEYIIGFRTGELQRKYVTPGFIAHFSKKEVSVGDAAFPSLSSVDRNKCPGLFKFVAGTQAPDALAAQARVVMIALDLAEGGTLEDAMRPGRDGDGLAQAVPAGYLYAQAAAAQGRPGRARHVFTQMVRGVMGVITSALRTAAKRIGLVHSDLKPANVLMRKLPEDRDALLALYADGGKSLFVTGVPARGTPLSVVAQGATNAQYVRSLMFPLAAGVPCVSDFGLSSLYHQMGHGSTPIYAPLSVHAGCLSGVSAHAYDAHACGVMMAEMMLLASPEHSMDALMARADRAFAALVAANGAYGGSSRLRFAFQAAVLTLQMSGSTRLASALPPPEVWSRNNAQYDDVFDMLQDERVVAAIEQLATGEQGVPLLAETMNAALQSDFRGQAIVAELLFAADKTSEWNWDRLGPKLADFLYDDGSASVASLSGEEKAYVLGYSTADVNAGTLRPPRKPGFRNELVEAAQIATQRYFRRFTSAAMQASLTSARDALRAASTLEKYLDIEQPDAVSSAIETLRAAKPDDVPFEYDTRDLHAYACIATHDGDWTQLRSRLLQATGGETAAVEALMQQAKRAAGLAV